MIRGDFKPVRDVALSSAIVIIPRALYRGVILYFCWLWFAVPYGLPPLNYWTGVILGGVVSTLTFEHIGEIKSPTQAYKRMIEWLIGINMFFLLAFIVYITDLPSLVF